MYDNVLLKRVISFLEEIEMEGKELFKEVGGEEFTTLACLNDDDAWADTIGNWVNEWAEK